MKSFVTHNSAIAHQDGQCVVETLGSLNRIHVRALWLTYNNHKSSFPDLR